MHPESGLAIVSGNVIIDGINRLKSPFSQSTFSLPDLHPAEDRGIAPS
jgi:hypothetical protein